MVGRKSNSAVYIVPTYENLTYLIKKNNDLVLGHKITCFAGHLNVGETLENAIKREFLEECFGFKDTSYLINVLNKYYEIDENILSLHGSSLTALQSVEYDKQKISLLDFRTKYGVLDNPSGLKFISNKPNGRWKNYFWVNLKLSVNLDKFRNIVNKIILDLPDELFDYDKESNLISREVKKIYSFNKQELKKQFKKNNIWAPVQYSLIDLLNLE